MYVVVAGLIAVCRTWRRTVAAKCFCGDESVDEVDVVMLRGSLEAKW
jgi:hypothetical protein